MIIQMNLFEKFVPYRYRTGKLFLIFSMVINS